MIEYEATHVHTYISNCILGFPDSPASQEDYAKRYKELGMQCLTFTEHGYRSDCWQTADLAAKYGMKAIVGAECYFVPDRKEVDGKKDPRNFHMVVIAKNHEGFRQLNYMLSEAWVTGFYKKGRIDFELLSQVNPDNFLITTACLGGIFKDPDGERYAERLAEMFPHSFYLEVQPHLVDDQIQLNKRIIEMSNAHKWPIILGTDSHYVMKEDKVLRNELIASAKSSENFDDEFDLFLPTAEEARDLLKAQDVLNRAQIEEAMENTLQVREFESFTYDTSRKFPITRLDMTEDERKKRYVKLVRDNYIEQFGKPSKEEAAELNAEVKVVCDTKSYDYFLSLYDMMEKGKELGGVVTKTSRGSAASFATSAALKFTSLNRLHEPVKLYPDRFVSKEKLERAMPDIDNNVAEQEPFDRAGKIVFGENCCYPMIALGSLKTLSAFKLLSRAHNIDPEVANIVSKQIGIYETSVKHAIENGEIDDDDDINDVIPIENYVDEEYIPLINDSKQYMGIKTDIKPHPCARLCYHKDLRYEIGLISLKPKTKDGPRRICAFIEGATADNAGYCKNDVLKVDVVDVINNTFKDIGMETPGVDGLKDWINTHPEVWQLYEKGFTLGLNQCEKAGSTKKVMNLKPKNVVELAAFVAAIRPGAKSLVGDFCNRTFHNYGIPAMDKMLKLEGATGVTGESSFVFYDEQILHLAQAAGISPADAVTLIKSIKKKKKEKVLAYKERFIPGFAKYLVEKENDTDEHAQETANAVWTVIQDSAAYLFNASHALAMAYDSLYGAMLKTIAPYEFYRTLLRLYTDKKQKDKVSLAINEMKAYKGITMATGRFGQDNRDWYIDKEHHTISQALSSIKNINQTVADTLYEMRDMKFDTFSDLLYYIKCNTKIDTRQMTELITLNYFEPFGKTEKLFLIRQKFEELKITKMLKSWKERLDKLKEYEASLENKELSIFDRAQSEFELTGLVFSTDKKEVGHYMVIDLEDKYGFRLDVYNLATGLITKNIHMRKDAGAQLNLHIGDIIEIPSNGYEHRDQTVFRNGRKEKTGYKEWWIKNVRNIRGTI